MVDGVIHADESGIELEVLQYKKIDIDLTDTEDFEMVISAAHWNNDINYRDRIYIPDTEYGGFVGGIETSTADNAIIISGRVWRGMLNDFIIEPPAGQSHKVVSGDVHMIMRALIAEADWSGLFYVPEDLGVTVTAYQFDRYCTLLSGLEKMLVSVGLRIDLKYIPRERGMPGYVRLMAAEITDYSGELELSQDYRLDFTFKERKNGVNHLICLGTGELQERLVRHLYVQADGSIGTVRYYKGLCERTAVYDNTSATEEELIERGTERLRELMNNQEFNMDLAKLDIEVDIGDIVGGRDRITGRYLAKPIVNKIYTATGSVKSVEYKLEGEEA